MAEKCPLCGAERTMAWPSSENAFIAGFACGTAMRNGVVTATVDCVGRQLVAEKARAEKNGVERDEARATCVEMYRNVRGYDPCNWIAAWDHQFPWLRKAAQVGEVEHDEAAKEADK